MMKMLWNDFSKTIDKFEFEIGQIHESIFIFFLDCSAQMLTSSDIDFVDRFKQNLDFDAE